jgi:hypothetical protein
MNSPEDAQGPVGLTSHNRLACALFSQTCFKRSIRNVKPLGESGSWNVPATQGNSPFAARYCEEWGV